MRRTAFANLVSSFALGLLLPGVAITMSGCAGNTAGTVVTPPPTLQAQTIALTPPASPVTYAPAGLTVTLSATGGGSGNPVVFTVDTASTGKASVSGNTLTITGAGNVIIDANQAGNSSYSAAPQVQATIVVNKAMPVVSWSNPAAITYPAPLSSTQLNATASVPGVFVYNPAAGAILPVGTQTVFVGFTPTDAVDYASISTSVMIVVNPAVPALGNMAPRYVAGDSFLYFVNYTIPCAGCASGDIVHDASGLFSPDLTLPSATSSIGITLQWQPGTYQPWFGSWGMEHLAVHSVISQQLLSLDPSQSTLAVSPTTGMLFQDEQATGKVHTLKTDGTTGVLFSITQANTPTYIAVDDVSGNVAYVYSGNGPQVVVRDETGAQLCYFNPAMSFISSVAAKGGYMVLTDSVDNLVGVAKMDCTGYPVTLNGQAWTGQPWAVAMVNGAELDAYVLTRDKWSSNGLPGFTKFRDQFRREHYRRGIGGAGWRLPLTPYAHHDPVCRDLPVVAFSPQNYTAAVLYMSTRNDESSVDRVRHGFEREGHGDHARGAHHCRTADRHCDAGNRVQFSLVGCLHPCEQRGSGHAHRCNDLTTGSFIPTIGWCRTECFPAVSFTANGVYCTQGGVIQPPLVLQP